VALIFMDLDNFKNVNDTLGHAAGDEVLRTSAKRIQQSLRDADTAARLGGDEFAVVLPDMDNMMDAKNIAQRILDSIAMPLVVHGEEIVTTASMGIALFPADSNDDQGLLREADIAMYRSKSGGGNAIEFFTPEMNERAIRRMRIESQLQRALDLDEFEVHYQPIVSLPDGQLIGVEALLRWNNSVLGAVSPAEFIPMAERSGIIESIGAWVLETACRQVKEWQDAEWPDLRVAVNLSPRELDRGDAVKMIARALDRTGLPAKSLEIEVTERVLLDDVDRVTATFRQIKELGVGLCIDDFGTGYSSLSYLRNYPFDVLKIDRAFIHDATRHNSGVSLLRAILAMAESLGLKVVAEGVETKAQMDLLCRLHCGFAQGYFFCPPMSAETIGIGGPVVDVEGCPVSSWPDREA
jgi:diguanylate cyclase (GGDEF)-like protein